ncbi:MAG: ABC-type sugar transport system, ATPase component [uncultured archaeon A07HB70]|jgi:ABC-type sugar transport systems, ATPase components|nr:MAG: ABC-type sugar transport system, ATPase component [uncultured archaeon A07HB70]
MIINDRVVNNTDPKDRNLAFVFQSIALFPHMTVRRNIRFGLDMQTDLSGENKQERVEDAAATLGIRELLDRSPGQLSGGQQQRVALGRAMVMKPAAFLLDEPFSALDANLRDEMQTEVKRLQRELNTAMVFVTHDQEEAMTLGDTIVVMNDGKIQQAATPYEIYNDPANRFVAGFIGSPSTNFIQARVTDRSGVTVAADEFELSVPEEHRDVLVNRAREDVELAVRPENVALCDPGDGLFDATVSVVEPQGENDVVYLEGPDTEMRATSGQQVVEKGDEVGVSIGEDEFWVFGSSGERLV